MSRTAESTVPAVATALDILRSAVSDSRPPALLDPAEYALGHTLFEARSDQRSRLAAWLVDLLTPRAVTDTRVLSVGCGDGSVDVEVATALASLGHVVDYLGVEPHPSSAQAFLARLTEVAGVHAGVAESSFAQVDTEGTFDVVLAVHSLYYVHDLAATLRRARGLLAPGGVLVVLHAPCEALNRLVRLLAPGRRQEFSDQVAAELRGLGESPEVTRIENRLDLTETGDADTDRRLIDFTVQARLPAAVQRAVRTVLAEQALPGPGLVVEHPVDALVLHAPDHRR